jgi:hypothetical protein
MKLPTLSSLEFLWYDEVEPEELEFLKPSKDGGSASSLLPPQEVTSPKSTAGNVGSVASPFSSFFSESLRSLDLRSDLEADDDNSEDFFPLSPKKKVLVPENSFNNVPNQIPQVKHRYH